ncbi:long-chain fatty acid--CoA ligase [Brevibacterium daeguense]|uniref:Long-chain fatty acid--CoA ligase n=1 Tax=Brevibacterium daeguense TaxID=909936 RepID=A0ABP8EF91_9MICO|nr:AMP-binding protein [Brevibacterium daeguense]
MNPLITDALAGWTRLTPDAPAIVYDGQDVVSFREIDEWTDNAAHHLRGLGLEMGQRVGILGTNSLEWVVAGVGALKAGAVVVPLNERFVAQELEYMVTRTSASLILHADSHVKQAEQTGALAGVPVARLAEFNDLRPRLHGHQQFARPEVDSASPAVLIFTSGTSARPKAAVYTHDSLQNMINENARTNSVLGPGTRWLYVLGMSGAPGLPFHILQALNRGATLYYEKGFDPKNTLRRLADDKIEMMMGVPLLFEAMMAQPEFAEADLSALQYVTIAGARCSPEVLKSWLAKGVSLRQSYGMTEASGLSTVNSVADAMDKPEFCGRGTLYTTHRVVRPDGTDCDPGELGEILVKGPLVISGYWENEEATREAFRDGWFHSGDLGRLDETGNLQIVDRLKDLIISGGYNIAPAEIENAIAAVPGVIEVCVIATPDERFGETPTAIVHGSDGLTEEMLAQAIEGKLASYKRPKNFIISGEPLPRMASGKIARRIIRDHFSLSAQG